MALFTFRLFIPDLYIKLGLVLPNACLNKVIGMGSVCGYLAHSLRPWNRRYGEMQYFSTDTTHVYINIQLTLIVSNSVDSNFRLSLIFIEVPNFVVYKYRTYNLTKNVVHCNIDFAASKLYFFFCFIGNLQT